jgi:hypothetical protein
MHAALALCDRFRIGAWRRRYNELGRNRLQGRRNNKRWLGLRLWLLVATAHVSVVVYLFGIIFEARGKSRGVLPLVGSTPTSTADRGARSKKL